MVPREDDSTINIFSRKVKERHNIKTDNLDAMLGYVNNKTVCRNIHILKYFGETSEVNCGICDICMTNKGHNRSKESISIDILKILEKKGSTSREIIAKLQLNESVVLSSLQELLEDRKIKINAMNKYELR